ncbi:MAG: hypothetical protein N2378_06960 [Chloroflexaceae bacterium]|nr:hypothetical protein [Chloroflexaceae bacterium]
MTLFRNRYRIESARKPGWDYSTGWYFVTICTHRRQPFFGSVYDGVMHLSPVGALVALEWQRTAVVRPYVRLDAWVIMPDHMHAIIGINAPPLTDTDPPDVPYAPRGAASAADGVRAAPGAPPSPDGAASAADGGDPASHRTASDDGVAVETARRAVSTPSPTRSLSPRGAADAPRGAASGADGVRALPGAPPSPRGAGASLGTIIGQFKSMATRRIRAAGYHDFAWQERFYDVIIHDDRALRAIRAYIAANPRCWTRDRGQGRAT